MHRIQRVVVCLVVGLVVFVVVAPLVLYWLGLSGVQGLPPRPAQLASKEQQALVWEKARGAGVPKIEVMNPYSVAVELVVSSPSRSRPTELVAWWVASGYLQEHQRHKGKGWWHLSGTALTIWLTRHWSSEELLSAAVFSFEKRGLLNSGGHFHVGVEEKRD